MSASANQPADFVSFDPTEVEQSLAGRFEKQVALHHDRVALVGATRTLTYDQLNRLANRIARQIVRTGAAPTPTRVAIFLEKDVLNLAAILGVLKAGHAYVPMDPAFPAARNNHIIQDSSAVLVLTNTANLAAAQTLTGGKLPLLNLDEIDASLSDENLGLAISPDAHAYLIYTSGSTGQPKGVLQIHRNALHGCMRRTNLQLIAPSDRMTLFYSPSVMGAVYCIFGALLNGASLCPYDIREDGLDLLARWLRERHITVYHSVASVFRQFATTDQELGTFPDIRLVIFGGERVLVTDVDLVRKFFPRDCVMFTGLGSTETGTVRYYPITAATPFSGKVVPIGYPVEGMEIVLLGENGQPVAPGEVGEITVRSRYNALGYWNQPEATARAFVPDPTDPTYTSYHTGDIGCLTAGGILEHRGRKDFQVKIRGFRVEISEIETALLDYPNIAESLVVAREVGSENQLVAYVARKTSQPLALRPLRDFLHSRLPYYMIPTVFVVLDAIPRTPNNKVDRKALPAPDATNQIADEAALPPTTTTERMLVTIWQELLRRPTVGINQNFFDLGGHSLVATQLISRILDRYQVRLTMRTIFEAKNLAALAQAVDTAPAPTTSAEGTDLVPVARTERIPLSFAQRRMWIMNQLYPGSAAYNISNTVRLQGHVDLPALERALNEIVQRHEILRTVLPADEDGPHQVVRAFAPSALPVHDLRAETAPDKQTQVAQLIRDYVQRPFDLVTGPLLARAFVRLGAEESVLILVFSHIIYDNIWSSGIFFHELGALYAAYTTGPAAPLPPLPLQFADYAHWQRRSATADALPEHRAYWKHQLANLPPPLQVPGDRPRPAAPTFCGAQLAFHVSPAVKEALTDLGRRESATTFMILLAAWKVLLHRYTAQDDVVVGTPTGRRYRVETEGMIGLFINTLVLRSDCSGNPSFRDLLRRVRSTTIDAFSHDELQFEDLIAELRPDRESGANPLFQHLFIHRNAAHSGWKIPGLGVTPVEAHPGGAKFDLTLSILEDDHLLRGTLEYRTDVYSPEAAARLVENYQSLLASIAARADRPIWEHTLLAEAELALTTRRWNDTVATYPAETRTHQLFEQRAAAHPDKIAVSSHDASLTYAELNRRANQLAAHLRTLGVGPDVLVALCVERSADLVVGLLGILKAGGAYVPLDPGFPPERLAYMVADSRAPVFVTQRAIADRIPGVTAKKLFLDTDRAVLDRQPAANLPVLGSPDDLAYVIYTSGSTGLPKGVQLTHRALVNFLCSMQREPGIGPDDILQAVTTISFDIAALEIFLPLITGARVVVASRETSLDPAVLTASLIASGATIMQATPVTWRMLLDHGWNGTPRIKIFCGGEAMGADLAARLLATGGEVWNLYGPTETTIWSSVARIQAPADALTLGHPIANTEFQVFSAHLTPQPLGVPGELLIGGDGLARGYLNREELTREKFIPHPLTPGQRLYRTGDLVSRRADGAIEFLGRIDNQVKLRGYRIELGEIESCLAALAGMKQVVVIAREDQPGEKRLVAYYSVEETAPPATADFANFLKDRLPEYMIPSAFVAMKEFPLTPNRKVDRKALPKPEGYSTKQGPAFVEPLGPTEQAVAGMMAALLKVPRVGRLDNFFDLGGHSVLAVQLQTRIQRELGKRIELRHLFNAAHLQDLAALIAPPSAATAPDGEESGTI